MAATKALAKAKAKTAVSHPVIMSKDDVFSDVFEQARKPRAKAGEGVSSQDRQSISEQVAHRLLAMVKSGNLRPGDRLPTEQQMGIAFGISRPPLREALKALTLMGVLESRQGGRYSVTDLSPSRLIAPFNFMLSKNEYDVNEHFDARLVVDLELVRLCALRATPEQRQRILQHALDGRAFLRDPVAFRLLDIEFHQALNDGAGNQLVLADLEAVAKRIPRTSKKAA